MSANITESELREVTGEELRTVDGGFGWSTVVKLARQFFLPDETPNDFEGFVATLTPSERA